MVHLLLALALAVTQGGPEQRPDTVDLAIVHADVFDVRSGTRLPDRTVLVEAGVISAVLPGGEAVHADRTLDAGGRVLVPGFVDAHAHLAYVLGDSLSDGGGLITRLSADPDSVKAYREAVSRAYLPWGVTSVRDAGSAAADVAMLVDWLDAPRPDAPDIHPTGGALVSSEDGRVPFPGHGVVNDPEDAVETVREYHRTGIRGVKLYWRLREPEFVAALEEAERLGMGVAGHMDFKVLGFERALDLGLRTFDHAYTLGVGALSRSDYLAAWREHLPHWIGDRQAGRFYLGVAEYFNLLGPDDPRMERLIQRVAATDSRVVPTLHLFAQRFGLAPFESRTLGEFDDLSGLTDDQLEHARRGYRIMAEYVRRLHEAGVPLAAGTDWIDPGRALLSELWLLNRAGIPMADVLRIGTLGGAEVLGLADRIGTIEVGRAANLVLLEGDPLTDPDALLGPRTVIKSGRVVVEDGPPVSAMAGTSRDPTSAMAGGQGEGPRLVVLLAVDQLSQQTLEPLAPYLSGGLARLFRDGAWYTDGWVDHAVTVSHPGHVTLSTGLDPADHGIVDAAFYSGPPGERRFTDAVADSTERLLDGREGPGVSPRQIQAPGLWDWAADVGTRRVAVGTGRYASLLYARSPGDVYWFDRAMPGYVTSSFYRERLPDWVVRFNTDTLPALMADTVWEYSAPDSLRRLARRDSAAYESGGLHPTFPHRFHDEIPADRREDPRAVPSWYSNTPMPDEATLALARAAVREHRLGQRDGTDVLVVVLSQIDNIGHWYGPRSLELLDALWRLDRQLGGFLAFLDETVGRDRYVLGLSADHSAPPAPEYRRELGVPAVRVTADQLEDALSAANRAIEAAGSDPGARARAAAEVAESYPWVADAMTPDELLGDTVSGAFMRLYRNSYGPLRVPRYPLFSFQDGRSSVAREGVAVRLDRDAMLDLDTSVHGSPYRYDRSVPIIFYGPGVSPGCREGAVATRDVAPTLARLAGLPVPESVTGVPLPVGRESGRACF